MNDAVITKMAEAAVMVADIVAWIRAHPVEMQDWEDLRYIEMGVAFDTLYAQIDKGLSGALSAAVAKDSDAFPILLGAAHAVVKANE